MSEQISREDVLNVLEDMKALATIDVARGSAVYGLISGYTGMIRRKNSTVKDRLIRDIEIKISETYPGIDMDIHEIQRLMGHSNIQVTLEYIYTDDAELKAAYQKYAA